MSPIGNKGIPNMFLLECLTSKSRLDISRIWTLITLAEVRKPQLCSVYIILKNFAVIYVPYRVYIF
jgi:hypothetical protein